MAGGAVPEERDVVGVGVAIEAAVGAVIGVSVSNPDLEALLTLVGFNALDAVVVAPARSQGFGGEAMSLFLNGTEVFLG